MLLKLALISTQHKFVLSGNDKIDGQTDTIIQLS